MVGLATRTCRKLAVICAMGLPCLAQAAGVPPVTGPDRIHLNQTNTAELLFDEQTRDALARLSWRANIGTLQTLPDGRGLVYLAPSKQLPQVAILGAYDSQTQTPTAHVIRLIGAPTIEVDSEPNVSVTVEIAGATFGPQRTNAAGNALVPVEVPPGIDTAVTFAKDPHGNVTRDELPLNPPPFSRLLALCADGESALYVVEVNRQGELIDTASFSVDSADFIASSPTLVARGIFRVELTPAKPSEQSRRGEVRAVVDGLASKCVLTATSPAVAKAYELDGTVLPIDPSRAWRIGANLGWLTNGNRVSGPLTSLRVSYAFSGALDGLRAELEAGYTQSAAELLTTDDENLDLEVRTWPVFVSARYVFDLGDDSSVSGPQRRRGAHSGRGFGGYGTHDRNFHDALARRIRGRMVVARSSRVGC